MTPIPVPSKWIGWALAGLCAFAFGIALACPKPSPDVTQLHHAHDSTVHAVAVMDSVRSRVQNAHVITTLHLTRLKPLRQRVTLTPNAILVDGRDTLSGIGVGVVAQVVAAQDTTILALRHESATKDTMIDAADKALAKSQDETKIAEKLIPSKWSRFMNAARWLAVGIGTGYVLHAVVR